MRKQIILKFITSLFLILILMLTAACSCQSSKTSLPTAAATPHSTGSTVPIPGTDSIAPAVVSVSPVTANTASATAADTTAPTVISISPPATTAVKSSPTPDIIPDTTPPLVISTSPSNLAVNVAINTNITVTFSEKIDSSTINQETFTLRKGTIPVIGTVQCSENTATFKPSLALEYSTTYTAELTTGAKDLAGNPSAEDYRWSFITVAPPSGGGGGAKPPPHTSTPTPTKSPEIRTMIMTDADLPQPPIQGMTLHFLAPLQGESGPGKLQASYGILNWSVWFGADNGKLWVNHVPKREALPSSLQSFYDYLGIDQFTTYTEQDGRYWFTGIPPWLNIAQYDPAITKMPTLVSIASTTGQVTIKYILN